MGLYPVVHCSRRCISSNLIQLDSGTEAAITLVITVVAMKWKARQLLERQSPAYWPSDQNSWQGTEEAFPPCPPGPAPPGPSSSAPFRATHPDSCEPLSDSSACDKAGRKLRQSLCRRHPAIPLAWPVLVRSVEHPLKGLMDWKPPEHRELAYQTLDQNSWRGIEPRFPPCLAGHSPRGPSPSAPYCASHPRSCEPLSDSSVCDKSGRKLWQSLCRRHRASPPGSVGTMPRAELSPDWNPGSRRHRAPWLETRSCHGRAAERRSRR